MSHLTTFVQAAFVENLALTFFLGMCTFLAASRRTGPAIGVGLAVMTVMLVTVPANNLVHRHLLRQGAWAWAGMPDLDLSHLGLICYIGTIAAAVQVLEMVLDRFFPALFRALGIFLPLVTVNCAILGASLFMVERDLGFLDSVVYGGGTGFGWAVAVAALAAIRERLWPEHVPAGLRGLGIAFIVTGIMSMGFMAFSGIRLG